MNIAELLGETTEYDKKQAVEMKRPKSWLKSVSAFANGIGGMLIFGVTDDGKVAGIEDIKTASEFIIQDYFVSDGMGWIKVADKLMHWIVENTMEV